MKKWKELNAEEKQARVNKIKYWVLNGFQMASCVAFGYHLSKYVNARRRINFDNKYTMANMYVCKLSDGKYGFGIARLDPVTRDRSRNGYMVYKNADALKKGLNETISLAYTLEGRQNG